TAMASQSASPASRPRSKTFVQVACAVSAIGHGLADRARARQAEKYAHGQRDRTAKLTPIGRRAARPPRARGDQSLGTQHGRRGARPTRADDRHTPWSNDFMIGPAVRYNILHSAARINEPPLAGEPMRKSKFPLAAPVAQTLVAVAVLAASLATATTVQAAYPERPVKIVVPFAPGGANDLTAGIRSVPLGQALGGSLVIENA